MTMHKQSVFLYKLLIKDKWGGSGGGGVGGVNRGGGVMQAA